MKKTKFVSGLMVAFLGMGVALTSCKKEGCTDPLASNYEEKANHDDGSCEYDGATPGTTLEVTEDVTTPTTWSAATIKVCGEIDVSAALTISPGVNLVMCAGASLDINEEGSINAVGTATSPIKIKGEVASAGYWDGINIRSNNPMNQFDYVTVSDAGAYWGWNYAVVNLDGSAKLGIKNSTISNGEQYGLYAEEGTTITSFSNNTFSNNAMAGLNIHARHIHSLDMASNYNLANGEAHIAVRGGSITTAQTWQKTETPLLILGTISIKAGVTINPGANLMFESGEGIDVYEEGFLNATGTASEPIQFKGRYESAGYQAGINFRSNNPNNIMKYCNVTDGGSYWGWEHSGVRVVGRLSMDNCTVSNSNSWGVYVESSATLMCGGATQTDASGVMTYNTITGNGVGADADCAGGGCTVYFE